MMSYIKKYWKVLFVCFLITLLFSFPLIKSGLVQGHDLLFQLNRIQALSDAISNGDLFPKLFHYQNYGFGYGTPLFYSNFFIYIPAILMNLGLTLTVSYKIFLVLCCFLATVSMYYCSYTIFESKKVSYISCVLYIFSSFRITDVYVRAAVGEILAFIFIPLIVLAIYGLLARKKNCWLLMSLAFTGLLLSHNISFLICCGVFAIYLIVLYKQINRRTLVIILKAVILSLLLSAFYLMPMLEQMNSGLYAVNGYFNIDSLLHSTLYMEQIIKIDTTFGYLGHTYDLSQAATMNIGIVLTLLTPMYIFCKKKTLFMKLSFALSFLTIWMTTDYFPWKLFGIFGFMQFTWRVLIITLPLTVIVSCHTLYYFERENKLKYLYRIILFLSLIIGIYQLSPVYNKEKILRDDMKFSSSEYYHRGELSLGDYLPLNSTVNYEEYGQYIETNNQRSGIKNYSRTYNHMSFTIDETNKGDFYILPLIYYKGYIVELKSNLGSIHVSTYPDDKGLVAFMIPNDSHNISIDISYNGTKIQKLSSTLSIISFIILVVYLILREGRKRR